MSDRVAGPAGRPAEGLAVALRLEVAMLRAAERRRRFPLGVHVGVPAGPRRSVQVAWPEPPGYDAGLRADLVGALVGGWLSDRGAAAPTTDAPPGVPTGPALWLTRPGVPEPHDTDLDWASAATRAAGAHGLMLSGVHVVTRSGWLDLDGGASRRWKRLRVRAPAGPPP